MNSREALLRWLRPKLEPGAFAWLRDQCERLDGPSFEKILYLAFSQAVRHTGRAPLAVSSEDQAEAFSLHPGWDLRDWTLDQAARAVLLLSLPPGAKTVAALLALHQTADLGEHVALARSLFLLPDAGALLRIAREAIRSNMRDVFAAVSQRNPYPAEHCDDIAWNQMVVKCLFVDLPLESIYGLDRRANRELSRILIDLARERKAANRPLSPEAWRCIAPYADENGNLKPEK